MFTAKTLYNKNFLVPDIQIEILEQAQWAANSDYDALVSSEWLVKERLAKEAGSEIWDGMYYRVANVSGLDVDDKIVLKLGTIPYRYIATATSLSEQFFNHELEPLFHLSTAAIMRSSEGKYIFGKRSVNGSVDLIGGGVQPDEIKIHTGVDLERNLLKEMREEIGVTENHIQSIKGIGILQSITSNILIISLVQLTVSEVEMHEIFKNRLENEMSELIFVTEQDIKSYLKGMISYRPLIADLL